MNNFFDEELCCLTEAEYISKIREDLISDTEQVFLHLLKIYYWVRYNKNNKAYWSKEVYKFCNSIPKKKKKGRLSSSDIFNIIWGAWGDRFDYLINELNTDQKYSSLPRIEYNPGAKQFCKEYISWLSVELSENEKIDTQKVKWKIYELIDQYELEKIY